jgi:hypothetical protein
MFWTNLKGIIDNLPLMLSDSTDVSDISFVRVSGFVILIVLIISPIYMMNFKSELVTQFLPYWQGLATLFGTAIIANVGKKYIATKISSSGTTNNYIDTK